MARHGSKNLRVQSIPGIYASEVCEKFSEILAKSILSGKKTIVVFMNSPYFQYWHCP